MTECKNLSPWLRIFAQQTEAFARVAAVEDNLTKVADNQQGIQQDLTDTMLRLESQQMYSRKQTVMLTGDAIQPPKDDEITRDYVRAK